MMNIKMSRETIKAIKENAAKFFNDKDIKVQIMKNGKTKIITGINEMVGSTLTVAHLLSFHDNKNKARFLLTSISCKYVKVKCLIK